jgi:unsaturated rhamnogalacturonyl hydrolase
VQPFHSGEKAALPSRSNGSQQAGHLLFAELAGLALTLSAWPEDDPTFSELLGIFQRHLDAMVPHQDEHGMWHQVVDRPSSYAEYSVTAMTSFAIVRGLRRGWLDRARFEPVAQRAWSALLLCTGTDGSLVDVCAGTGKMKSLQEYLDRPAIRGRDDRGGAMALMLTTDLAFAVREGKWEPSAF